MGYVSLWKVLEGVILDFRRKGAHVPPEVINDLKNAQTSIKILSADPGRREIEGKVEEYLGKVESFLISEGQKRFGVTYVDDWLERADEARRTSDDEKEERVVHRPPRQRSWIRISTSKDLPLEKLKTLATESNLAYSVQTNECLLIQGEEKELKDFVKMLATKYRTGREQQLKRT